MVETKPVQTGPRSVGEKLRLPGLGLIDFRFPGVWRQVPWTRLPFLPRSLDKGRWEAGSQKLLEGRGEQSWGREEGDCDEL